MQARLLPTRRIAALGGSSRRSAGTTTLPKLAAVLLAALTAVAGLPIAGPAAAAGLESTGWQTESSSAAPEGTTTASPSGLTPGAARTFNAHDDTDGAFATAAAQIPDDSTAQTTDGTAQTTDGASTETDADDGAQAQSTVTLAASSITRTGATLTISNHTAAWYWQRHSVAPGPCSSAVAANTATATLTGLTPATAYTFKAYSDSTCSTELTNDTRDADFTTAGLVFSVSRVNVAEGSTAAYAVKLATAPTSKVTVIVSPARSAHRVTADTDTVTSGKQSALKFTPQNWDTAQTVTVKAATNPYLQYSETMGFEHTATSDDLSYSGAVASVGVWMVDQTESARLTVSSVTATGATLSVRHNFSTVSRPWYYDAIATPGSRRTCTSVAAGTSTVALTGLTPGTEYLYRTYLHPGCSEGGSSWDAEATFTTPGVRLSTLNLIAPEGATATYTARLATKPAGNVTVTVTKGAGGDADLTVDTDPGQGGNQGSLTFTAANWNVPQTVTVTAAEETGNTDTAYGTATFSHSATSGYTTTAASTLTVTEGDNDVCPGTTAVGGATVITGGLVDDCNTLLAAKTMLAGTSTAIDNWATSLAMPSWHGVTLADSRVTRLDAEEYEVDGTVPNTIGNLANLEALYVFGRLSGQLPDSLGDLSELRVLHVSGFLSGGIPAELGSLTSLTELGLGGNLLSGSIPAELGNLVNLSYLDLSHNRLSGSIPVEIGNLTNLQRLELDGVYEADLKSQDSQLSGSIPTELGNLTKVTRLYLGGQRLSGPIPATLRRLTKLQVLGMNDNLLSGPIPVGVGDLTSLTELNFRRNLLSGQIPAGLGSLSSLTELSLGGNLLSGSIPTQIGGLTGLERMELWGNRLTGAIPTEFGNLTSLTTLELGDNRLSGPIPTKLGDLTNLQRLGLDRNELSGKIPAELSNLTNLEWITLSDNNLSGAIPAELGNLTSLYYLGLSDNELSGQIPAELSNLTNLRALGLGRNQLSGSIPAELGNFVYIGVDVAGNLLSGCIPANWHPSWQAPEERNPQQFGKRLDQCDGVALSDTRPSVGEGSTADYTVRLSTEPSSTVTVTVSATGDSNITVDTNTTTGGNQDTLTFTTQNWDTAQTVRLTAAQDTDAVDGTATLTHTAASSDSTYSGTVATAVATEADDEIGINAAAVSATGATLEASTEASAQYYRRTSPTTGDCTRSWLSRRLSDRTRVVYAAIDGLSPNTDYTYKLYSDGNCTTEITTGDTDAEFTTASGVLLSSRQLEAAEDSTATYEVRLATAPTHNVTVALTKATGGDANLTFNPSSLSFTTVNWGTAQTVTVTAASDTDTDDGSALLVHTPSSTDTKYNSSPASIKVTERDNDAVLSSYAGQSVWAGLPGRAVLLIDNHTDVWYYQRSAPTPAGSCAKITAGTVAATVSGLTPDTDYTFKAYSDSSCSTELTTGGTDADFTTPYVANGMVLSAHSLIVAEGTSQAYTVRLTAPPSQDVAVTIAKEVGDDADLTFEPSSLSFTAQNWRVPQTVTVTAAQEDRPDAANGIATLRHTADSTYTTTVAVLEVNEADDDSCPGSTAVGGADVTSGGLVDDCVALLAARSALAGASGASALNWSANRDIGQWTGVTEADGRVIGVNLSNLGLDGALPSALGDLDALLALNLKGNSLTGPIPAQLGALTGLVILQLSGNSLTGCIPANLAALEALTSVQTYEINPQNTANGGVVLPTCSGIVVSDANPTVNEGGSVDYSVSLSTPPTGNVTVTLSTAAPSTSASVRQPGNAQAQGPRHRRRARSRRHRRRPPTPPSPSHRPSSPSPPRPGTRRRP